MTTQYTIDVTRKAVDLYGKDFQLDRLMEECSELIQAILHLKRGRGSSQKVIEEIADVYVTLESARHIFPSHFIDHEVVCKTSRLDQTIAAVLGTQGPLGTQKL